MESGPGGLDSTGVRSYLHARSNTVRPGIKTIRPRRSRPGASCGRPRLKEHHDDQPHFERGIRFRSAPHEVADLGDRTLWLSDFEDGEGNVFALMAEVPK